MRINKFNSEGYYDPTAYEALTNIHREKVQKHRDTEYKPLVFICSPFAGDIDGNTRRARNYCRFAVESNAIPLAPHLLYPQFMDELNPEHRELGLFFGRVLLGKCSELWVFGNTMSGGMQMEIKKAIRRNMLIRHFTEQCEEVSRA